MKTIYTSRGHDHVAARRITNVMTTPVITIGASEPLGAALATMLQRNVRHLVVVDGDGRCVGVLSDRSIAAGWAIDYSNLDNCPVSAALDVHPAVVREGQAVLDAARLMRASAVDAVAVIDTVGRPVGIVTGSDLIGLLTR